MARGRSGRKTDYEWQAACGNVSAVDIAVGVATVPIWFIDFTVPATLMRIRGHILLQLDAAGVDERALVSFGIGLFSTDARVAGAVPEVFDEAEFGWIWYGFGSVTSLAEAAIAGEGPGMIHRIEVDSKAMRKVKPNQSIALVAEVCSTSDMGGTVDILAGARVLFGT